MLKLFKSAIKGSETRSLNFTNKSSIESINTGLFVSYSTNWA